MIIPNKEMSVENETIVITGTGHGIGKELAKQYAWLKATVVCLDINESNNRKTVEEIKNLGGIAYAFTVDVTQREMVAKVAKQISTHIGFVSILVNNAGIMPAHEFLEHSESEIRKIFEINVLAHFWMLQAFLPYMIKNGRGHIVSLASVAGLIGLHNLTPYCSSKFATVGLMDALQEEIRHHPSKPDIYFTTIAPYMVSTGLVKNPKTRFPNLFRLVEPAAAATVIIKAQRQRKMKITIPTYMLYMYGFLNLFPVNATNLLRDLIDSGVESDKRM